MKILSDSAPKGIQDESQLMSNELGNFARKKIMFFEGTAD